MHKCLGAMTAMAILGLGLATSAAAAAAGGPPPAPVVMGQVSQRQVETRITLSGTAEPHRLLTVASRLEALVQRGAVEEGDRVAKGQVMVYLDPRELKIKLAEAQAVLDEEKADLAQFQRDLARQKSLYKTKSSPLKNLEDATTALERQEAQVRRTSEQTALLALDLADAEIRAPADGVVVKRLAYRGEWVKKGGPVAQVSVLDPLKVVTPVPERYLSELRQGGEVSAVVDALPGREFKGRVWAVIPQGDPASRTFPVQVRLANPEGDIKPGMLVRVTYAVGRPHQALLVPKDALVISGDAYSLIGEKDGRAAPLPVNLVAFHGDMAEVTGPVKAGTPIVVRGNERVFPGQPLKPVPPQDTPGGGPAAPTPSPQER